MRELSLFSGAGGGLLGSLLLGWSPIGYVEFNDYCQRVIAQRIKDGILPNAPIFGDIRTFVDSGCAELYRGVTDIVSGGFPCQPFSVAGKRAGADDERNMWPATIATIRAVQPRYCLLENVPGLLTSGYFGTILGNLVESGYDCRWRVLSAAELGAPHKRDRLWIVAYSNRTGRTQPNSVQSSDDEQRHYPTSEQGGRAESGITECGRSHVADTQEPGLASGISHAWGTQARQPRPEQADWWEVEPSVGRVVDGLAFRVDRLKAIGNGQVPIVAATAWRLLTEGLEVTP